MQLTDDADEEPEEQGVGPDVLARVIRNVLPCCLESPVEDSLEDREKVGRKGPVDFVRDAVPARNRSTASCMESGLQFLGGEQAVPVWSLCYRLQPLGG